MENNQSLKDRVILVTGAGQGLGRAAALACAGRGATVILLGRTTRKLEQVYDEIVAANGPMPAIFPMDLEKAADKDFDTLAQTVGYQLRRLDGILHGAAEFESPSPLGQQTAEEWQRLYKVNVIAPFAINRACLQLLAAAPDAPVILVGESHGHVPAAYWGGFAVSKAALEAYFRIQAEEWADAANLRLNLVIPGPVNSPQRAISHPGEDKSRLPSLATLATDLADLMGPEGHGRRGQLIEWHPASSMNT
ncbi:MAG: SDR family NAD(P)-dependent oxidoreductase [Gallionellaceae bacterium]|nr:SDR family NAD(P)-dependent oxidoreductase [Gallionellaceae bacterium]MDD5367055.1 SDR family NAD(P)-dependent oxidoreductase [Gallionellaceae bacterium]